MIKLRNPRQIAVLFNDDKIIKEQTDNIVSKIIASFTFNDPLASGLSFVLKTCLSKSLSKISLRMQPAPLVVILPIKNNNNKSTKL